MSRYLVVYCDTPEGCPEQSILRNSIEVELPEGGFSETGGHWNNLDDLEIWLSERLEADGWSEDRHGDATCPECSARQRGVEEAAAFTGCGLTSREAR